MAITGPQISSSILSANPNLLGTSWTQVATGIGMGVAQWLTVPSNVVLSGSVVGTVGAGSVYGKYLLNPSPLPLSSSLSAAGFLGLDASEVAMAVGLGVGASLNASAFYSGVSVGAIGADTSSVVFVNPTTLTLLITSNLAFQNIVGPLAPQLAAGLANGISAMVATGGGIGVASGTPGPFPGTGTSQSALV